MLHALPSERCLLSAPSCPDTAGPQTLPRPQQPKRGARRRAQAVPGSRAGIAHEHPGAAAPGLQARTVSGCRAAGGLRRICVPSTHEISQDPPERAGSLLPKAGRSLSCSARNVLSDPSSLLPSVEQRAGYSSLCTEVLGGCWHCRCLSPGAPRPPVPNWVPVGGAEPRLWCGSSRLWQEEEINNGRSCLPRRVPPPRGARDAAGDRQQGLRKSLPAFLVPETNYKRALKLSLAVAVFSAFLCLPLAVGWVNCSDSGAIVRCKRAMEAQGPPRAGGSLARQCRLPRHRGRRAACGAGHGHGHRHGLCCSTLVAWGQSLPIPRASSAPSLPIPCLTGELPRWVFWKQPGNGQFCGQGAGGSKTLGLPSPSCGEGAGADVGDASCGWCPPCPNPSCAGPWFPPPVLLQSCLTPSCSNARASNGSRCPILFIGRIRQTPSQVGGGLEPPRTLQLADGLVLCPVGCPPAALLRQRLRAL